MKTITTNQDQTITFSLNRSVAQAGSANLVLQSPSRPEITFIKALTDIGSGFFSLDLTAAEADQLIDDTYSYYLTQNGVTLKHGFIRRVVGHGFIDDDGQLDAFLDFLLA